MLASRRLCITTTSHFRTTRLHSLYNKSNLRNFSATAATMVLQAGDPIPSAQVSEGTPTNKFDLAEKLKEGKGLIIAVPAAFST